MAAASYVQTAFTGGEWSIYAQGRIDDPKYKTAMNVCFNSFPIEEGAWVRRPGTAFICTTRNGVFGRVIGFDFTDVAPFNTELTQGHLRLIEGHGLVFDSTATVVDISSANPAIVTTSNAPKWATNDQVQFSFSGGKSKNCAILRNRQFVLTKLNATQWTLADPVTGVAVNGANINYDPTQGIVQLNRVLDFATPYQAEDINGVRSVVAAGEGVAASDNNGSAQSSVQVLLHGDYQPRVLTGAVNPTAPNFSSFSLTKMAFSDGPYLNQPNGATLSPNVIGQVVTFVIGYQAWSSSTPYSLGAFVSFGGVIYQSLNEVNLNQTPNVSPTFWQAVGAGAAVGPNGFQATDVGRLMRVHSEPAAWSNAASYNIGDPVFYNAGYYVAQSANSGQQPDTNLASWLPTTSLAVATWTWGVIATVNSPSSVTVNILGPAVLYTSVINEWAVGVYSDTTGWPTCGSWYEGRLWLGGVIANRFDASVSNDPFNFQPTAYDGTVGDANGISDEFNSTEQNTIFWIEPTNNGLLCGTLKGEWLIQASNLNDPITPTSIQAHRVTKIGCFDQVPIHTPLSMVVIQRFQRLLYEIFPDLFSGKITAPNLNSYSKHITKSGVAELGYQSELVPIVWGRNNDGSLVGWTYQRKKQMSSEGPDFVGAHRHALGSGRTVASLTVSPTPDQTSDSVLLTTKDPVTGVYHVEQMTQLLDPQDTLTAAWFVDDAVTPSGLQDNGTGVTLFGMWHLAGKTVSVVCGGLDLGDFIVQADGSITVPYSGLFTFAYLQGLNANTYGDLAVSIDSSVTTTPGLQPTPQVIRQIGPYPQSPVTGISAVALKPDYALNRAFIQGTNGIRLVDLAAFTQISAATYAAINATGPGGTPDTGFDWTYGVDGFLYFRAVGSNQSPWIKINPATWTIVATFGTNSNFWSGGPTGLGAPSSLTSLAVGSAHYLAGVVQAGAFQRQIAWMNADAFTYLTGSTTNLTAGFEGIICAGPQNANGATAFVIECPEGGTNPSPVSVGTWTTSVDALGNVTTVQTGSIVASSIDPSWANFTSAGSFARDPIDGQLLVGFQGGVGITTTGAYLCKFSAANGALIWKTKVGVLPGSLNLCRFTGGVLFYVGEIVSGATRWLYQVNTVTGQVNKVNGVTNVVPFGLQISDDQTGRLLLYAQYAQTGGSPVPAAGDTSAWQDWSELTAGNMFQGRTVSTQSYTIPAVIGFTYLSQGQLCRPNLPQEAGSPNGPALAKTRRNHMFGMLVAAGVYGSMKVGTILAGTMRAVFYKTPGGKDFAVNQLFQGVWWDTIEDDGGFDGMLAWSINRPLPASISSISGFIQTQDR